MSDFKDLVVRSEGTYEQPETGMHQAVCVFIHDIGTQVGEYQGKPNARRQVIITWELLETMTKGELAGKRFTISKFYTKSLNEKATLRKDLEGWRGRTFSEEELKGFLLSKLVRVNCFLNLVETKSGKRAIASISPLAKGMPVIQAEQLEPNEKFQKWIDGKRSESVEMQSEDAPQVQVPDDGDGLLPF